jgi:DNA-binding IscR family transcriptional regulator
LEPLRPAIARCFAQATVEEILEALEGPVLRMTDMNGGAYRATPSGTLLAKVWDRVHAAERHVLEGITVEELAGEQRHIEQQRSPMYHI